jgi:hypothetical protein
VQYFDDALRDQPFSAMASRLRSEIAAAEGGLRAISDETAAVPRAAGKWSRKETLGHLIDSASNNHQRFARAESGATLRLPGYAQDRWVDLQGYGASAWTDLIDLWSAYNRHLAHLLERIPESLRGVSYEIGGGEPVSLGFVALDYIGHLQHHLRQILDASISVARPDTPLPKPEAGEHADFLKPYVDAVGAYHPFALLRAQTAAIRAVFERIDEALALHRYAEGKWSVKETLGHLSDAERMVSHWLFRISRGDTTPLLGYDERLYVTAGGFDSWPMGDLIAEFASVREASLRLVASTPSEGWEKWGVFKTTPMTARAAGYILAGHVEYHLELLRDRYGVPVPSMELRYGPPA